MAYAIAIALKSGVFERVVVSTDSELTREIALHYGAEAPFLRPVEFATSTSPDIEWIKHALGQLGAVFDVFSILRPTSPFRTVSTIRRAMDRFLSLEGIDSLRAVELCKDHPGKMWVLEGDRMTTLLDQSHLEIPWHAGQYQGLPKVYVQNSSLEIAWTRVVWQYSSREGKVLAPFLTEGCEGFSIDYESDWVLAEWMIAQGQCVLPHIPQDPFPVERIKSL